MNMWNKLKRLIKAKLSHRVHYSFERAAEHDQLNWVLKEMQEIEKEESLNQVFLFTDIPTFDQKAWEKILEEKGLQGLS